MPTRTPPLKDIVAWLEAAFPGVAAAQPDKGGKLPAATSSDWADYIINAGPIGTFLNKMGFSMYEDLPFGMSDQLYRQQKRFAEGEPVDIDIAFFPGDAAFTGEWVQGWMQRNLIDYWRDKINEENISSADFEKFKRARDRYIDDPSVKTYNDIQRIVTEVIPTAASPSWLEDKQAELVNEYLPLFERGDVTARERSEFLNRIENAQSSPELVRIKDEILTKIQTRVPGDAWSEKITTEITQRGGTRTPGDWTADTRFTQQGLEELGGMPAFGMEYSQTGRGERRKGEFTPQPEPDPVAAAIANLTGIDGWPVRLENGNVLIYRGTLPNGQPMLLGEFDWDEENSRLFKVGSGTSADPTSISTSVFVDAFGNEKLINSETGEVIRDLGVGFDAVESGRDFTENQRQFSATYGLQRDRLTEDQRQFDLGLGEDVRQFDMSFGEGRRQFDTTEGRMERTLAANNYFNSLEELGRNYRTFIQTAPQMANAATNQGQLIADILRSGGDVLARTYFTRGGISPLPEITQADLINNLNSEMAKIQQYEVDATRAENRRREAADRQRAQSEFTQFRTDQDAAAKAAYGRYAAEMRPTYAESFDAEGFSTANAPVQKKIDALNAMKDWLAQPNQTDSAGNPIINADAQIADVNAQLAAAQASLANPADYTETEVIQQTPMGFSEWLSSSQYGGPQMGFDQWSTQVGPSFAPTPLLDVPQVPVPTQVTQPELIQQARATTPPAVASVIAGQMPTPMQFGGLPLPTFQQLQALTPTEQQMLNTRLMTEFNVPLEDVAWQSRRQFATPSMERNRDLARFRGYAV